MEIVIDIPEEDYILAKKEDFSAVYDGNHVAKAIKHGTPLPKRHGKLKDVDAFITKVKADRKHSAYLRSWTADDVLNALDNSYAPTIIGGSENE